jgi:hypothetical protein
VRIYSYRVPVLVLASGTADTSTCSRTVLLRQLVVVLTLVIVLCFGVGTSTSTSVPCRSVVPVEPGSIKVSLVLLVIFGYFWYVLHYRYSWLLLAGILAIAIARAVLVVLLLVLVLANDFNSLNSVVFSLVWFVIAHHEEVARASKLWFRTFLNFETVFHF